MGEIIGADQAWRGSGCRSPLGNGAASCRPLVWRPAVDFRPDRPRHGKSASRAQLVPADTRCACRTVSAAGSARYRAIRTDSARARWPLVRSYVGRAHNDTHGHAAGEPNGSGADAPFALQWRSSRTLPADRAPTSPRSVEARHRQPALTATGDETVTAIATPPDHDAPPCVDAHQPPAARVPGESAEAILTCHDLRKRFGDRTAVDGIGFTIRAGETYGLLGPNGAGKTTTISMICGILAADAGEVHVAGIKIDTGTVAAKGAIGYVPQDLAIYPNLSARENLAFFGRLYGLRGAHLRQRIAEVLAVIDLAGRADERAERFSGGMKRRLNIGIGLLHRPRLLVLDEPTVGVDPQSRNAILSSVEALSAAGMGILYTTHYMEEAERLCNRVGIIHEGRIIAEGSRRELVALVGGLDTVKLGATGDLAAAARAVRELDGVRDATTHDGGIDLLVVDARRLLPSILASMNQDGQSVRSVEVVEPDLEAVFLHLTGKALRD
ncbi:MAG: ABC transporter ATP-binding protein [Chloroflexi bacterium]|nr:ABC transporter ATP-binding protein [Chloroflexota bacterium]